MHKIIFERFRQFDNSATRKYGGTGVGLALSKGYIELLGGTIKLTSEPKKGSVFSFTLPYKPIIKTKATILTETDPKISKIKLPPGKTILVAEDETNNFLLINELLVEMKLNVIRAETGLEVMNKCSAGNLPDLILMDIKMPVMDGIEATKKIKKLHPGLPVIVLTAYALEVDKKRIFESGCDDYLVKPIQYQMLFETLLKYLKA
jgi:CheY-like chemotaxis protein